MRDVRRKILALLSVVGMLIANVPVYALPDGYTVESGTATIDAAPTGKMTVTVASEKAIINYSYFDLTEAEAVEFIQPNTSSVVLNRVTGSSASDIRGSIVANGRIFLVNPNGVFIGSNASVDASGFVASSLRISSEDFLADNYMFTLGEIAGNVQNDGLINVDQGGVVALIGRQVINNGIINAGYGRVGLASGDSITVDFDGDNLINFNVNWELLDGFVQNAGEIHAGGGSIILTAQSVADIAGGVVNNFGILEAQSVDSSSGTIRLVAANSTVTNFGQITTAGRNGAAGGTVEIEGDIVTNDGTINVSGDAGALGGTVTLTAGEVVGSGEVLDVGADNLVPEALSVVSGTEQEVVNTGIIGAIAGVVNIVSGGDVTNSGAIDATDGAISIDAEGDVVSSGTIIADSLAEQGASFEISGTFVVDQATADNEDSAVTLGTGTYGGSITDTENIMIAAGAVINMISDFSLSADWDADGTGLIDMGLGSSVVGGGFNLSLFASEGSMLSDIAGVNTLLLDASLASAFDYLMGGSIHADQAVNAVNSSLKVENLFETLLNFENLGSVDVGNGLIGCDGLVNSGAIVISDSSGSIFVIGDTLNTNGATLSVGDGQLQIGGTLRNDNGSSVSIGDGEIAVGGNVINLGPGSSIANSNGLLDINGSLFNMAASVVNNTGVIGMGSSLYNEYGATFLQQGAGDIYVGDNVYLDNNAVLGISDNGVMTVGGSMSVDSGAVLNVSNMSVLDIIGNFGAEWIAGDVSIADNSALFVGRNLYNKVYFTVSWGSLLEVGETIVNEKTMDIIDSDVFVGRNLYNRHADFSASNGSYVDVFSAIYNNGTSTFITTDELYTGGNIYNCAGAGFFNTGLVEVGHSFMNVDGATLNNEGFAIFAVNHNFYNFDSSTVNNNVSLIDVIGNLFNGSNSVITNGEVSGRGGVSSLSLIGVGGDLYNEGGATLTNNNYSEVWVDGNVYNNTGAALVTEGYMDVLLSVFSYQGSRLAVGYLGSLIVGGNLASAGTVDLTGFEVYGLADIGGHLINESDGTITGSRALVNVGGSFMNTGAFGNSGSMNIAGGINNDSVTGFFCNTGNVTAGGLYNNGGEVYIFSGGSVVVDGDVINHGVFTFPDSNTLDISGNFKVGKLYCSGDAVINVGGNWSDVTDFLAGNSVVTFDGSAVSEVETGGFAFYDVVIGAGKQVDMSGALYANNDITMLDGSIISMTGDLVMFSDYDLDGNGLITMSDTAYIYGNGNAVTVNTKHASTLTNFANYFSSLTFIYQD